MDVFNDIDINTMDNKYKDFKCKTDLYCRLLYDRACIIALHRSINCILKQCNKYNIPLLVFRYHNNLSMMQKAMRNVVVIERKLYNIINKTRSRNFNNEWDHVAQNAFNKYDIINLPNTLEWLSLSNVFCNVDCSKCEKLIGVNLNCIAYKQIKFPQNNIIYLKCIMKNAKQYMTEWKYVTSSNIERKNDYLIDLDYDDGNGNGNDNDIELPIPVRLVYLQDETGCIS
eukprot:17922_1